MRTNKLNSSLEQKLIFLKNMKRVSFSCFRFVFEYVFYELKFFIDQLDVSRLLWSIKCKAMRFTIEFSIQINAQLVPFEYKNDIN